MPSMDVETARQANATLAQRRITLEVLARYGAQPVEAIPRAWPLTLEEHRAIVRSLEIQGSVAMVPDTVVPGRPLARITDEGRLRLKQLTDEGMRELAAAGTAMP